MHILRISKEEICRFKGGDLPFQRRRETAREKASVKTEQAMAGVWLKR
jgi:hypothetical protein